MTLCLEEIPAVCIGVASTSALSGSREAENLLECSKLPKTTFCVTIDEYYMYLFLTTWKLMNEECIRRQY